MEDGDGGSGTDSGKFTTWDYVVFSIVLAISASIGLFHACVGKRQRTTSEFLLAGKSMSALPVALSIFASFFSASTMLGTPVEIYTQGTMYWMAVWGAMCAPLVGAFLFGPFFHHLKILSVFEYLERRFKSRSVRLLGSTLFIIKSSLGMGIVMFGPSVALTEVTGFPVWANIIAIGFVCCFYTALGGMKAVIWTDVFQTAIMLAGLLAAIIQGSIDVGGLTKVWNIADSWGRIEFFDFNPDPTVRHTFWTLVIGSFFGWLPPYSVDQQMIQRFASTTSLNQSILALVINIPSIFAMITLCSLLGLVMFSFYAQLGCDPLTSKLVKDPNQLVPRFVMDIFSWAPGVPGLFVASLFCGALSSVSSMLNSLAAVTWEDFIKLIPAARKLSDMQATFVTKLLAVAFTGLGIGMAFVFSNVGGTVLQMSLAFNGAVGAPLVGLFLLGAFFPWINWIGALAGGVLGFMFPMWISIGAYVTKPSVLKRMNNNVANCSILPAYNDSYDGVTSTGITFPANFTAVSQFQTTTMQSTISGIVELYTLSYLWYTAVGILTTLFVAVVVSFLTGYVRAKDVDSSLMMSYVDKFWCCFPESCKTHCRCGIDYKPLDINQHDDEETEQDEKQKQAESMNGVETSNVNGIIPNDFAYDTKCDVILFNSTDIGIKNSYNSNTPKKSELLTREQLLNETIKNFFSVTPFPLPTTGNINSEGEEAVMRHNDAELQDDLTTDDILPSSKM